MGEPGRDTSGVTTRVIVLYVREHGGDQAVAALLRCAGETRSADELLDEHRWSSYEQKIRLFRAAVEVLGDPGAVRRIGQFMLRSRIALPLLVLLRALGSPEQVLRNLAKANSRFSTSSTVQALQVGNGHAVVSYRLHQGFVPDVLDCQYTKGLLSLVPEVFGLPAASVHHEECQVRGAPACLYWLTWRPRHRWGRRVQAEQSQLRDQLDAITQRFQELQSVSADLVSTEDVSTVLASIATKASHAVRAPRYLLAARATQESPLRVHHQGFTEEEAAALGERLIRGERLEHVGSWLIADIASARSHYGKLGAVYAQEEPFFPEERQLLVAYARQAAAALDAATALEAARGRHATSRALLQLAEALANLATPEEVAERIAAAVPGVVAAGRSTVSLWDATTQRLSTVATHGWPPELEPMIGAFTVRPSDTPELADMLTDSHPRCYRRGSTDDPAADDALARFHLSSVAVVPIVARGEFLGVVTAATDSGQPPLDFRDDTEARLVGLASQAAVALSNARLLAQERATLAELRRSEAQVKHQAAHDALTGLANRALFGDLLRSTLKRGVGVAVLFVDLDDFKAVNDSLGHAAGDDLLAAVSARLAACMRVGDTVARLGGDEFAVLIEGADERAAVQTAERLIAALGMPLALPGTTMTVRASIGIAVAPPGAGDAGEVLRNADVAMYAAKEAGKGRLAVFEPGMHTRALDLIEQEHDLREAIGQDQFVLHYQPVVELASGRMVGVEALVRWRHPTRGLRAPSEFIPLAEATGLVVDLGRSILDKACRQAMRWREATDLRLGVNLSARQLTDPDLIGQVAATLSATRLPAERLVLEITETALLNSAPDRVLTGLRELGARIALDDFGTGNSSLEHLQRFPVDSIKIDKVFVDRITGGLRESALARAIVQLGQTMGLATVAEGVKTAGQAAILRELGCGYGQGYFFAKPMSGRSLGRLVHEPQRKLLVTALFLMLLLELAAPAWAQGGQGSEPFVVLSGRADVPEGEQVGDLVVFHGSSTVEGTVDGSLTAFDAPVVIAGRVNGDVVAFNGRVELRSGASVTGDVVSRQDPVVASGATIGGERRRLETNTNWEGFGWVGRLGWWLAVSLSTLVVGLVLVWLAGRGADRILEAGRTRIGPSIGLGLLLFFGLPILAVVALVTIVGIPLGIGLLAGLLLIHALGYSATAWILGRSVIRGPTGWAVAFLAGWAILRLVALVPILGGLAWFAAVVFGLGALAVAIWRARTTTQAPAPARA